MKSIVREIVFKFSIQRFNRDFLLNVKAGAVPIIQIMHRAHFPTLLKNISDVQFGLAIYIPLKPLSKDQKETLANILNEEAEKFESEQYPTEFFVVDAGSRVRFTGYLLSRIIREAFGKDDVELELYDEGNLPYHSSFDIPRGQLPLN